MAYNFSIITPNYNMLNYLKLCQASIKDQTNVSVEHIVVDGNSNDGTVDWLKQQKNIKWISEKDKGMYDAINKGLKMATGDILAYLNCDEQYLPGTLEFVKKYFDTHPDVDLIFGHALIADNNGNLLSFRKSYRPRYPYIITSILYNLSCTMFFRRKIIENNLFFSDNLKVVADADFVIRILKNKYKTDYVRKYLSVFLLTGKNMSLGQNARKESKELKLSAPWYIKYFSLLVNITRYIEKFLSGAYFQKYPIQYEIYTLYSQLHRKTFKAKSISYKWPKSITID